VLRRGSIPPGRYTVVAGALSTTVVASEPIEIEQRDALERQLMIPVAGLINARLGPAPNSRPVAIELLLELITPSTPDDPRLVTPQFRALKDRRRGRFDLAGKLRFEGVSAGRYRLSARVVDPSEVATMLRLRVGELSAFDRLELDAAGTGSIELTLESVPAARVSGVLKCLDGESTNSPPGHSNRRTRRWRCGHTVSRAGPGRSVPKTRAAPRWSGSLSTRQPSWES
jgi:hypothetical protein